MIKPIYTIFGGRKGECHMKMKWKRLVLAGAIFSALFAGTAFGGTWLKGEGVNQDRWWYANEDGTYANNDGSGLTETTMALQKVTALTPRDGFMPIPRRLTALQ